jgi:hypothetical protein
MSSWGNLDNVTAAGTVTSYTGNSRVNGSSTYFTSNIKEGDYLIITGTKFQVGTVTSDTVLDLTSNGKSASGATAYVQQGPKYIANISVDDNVYTIQNVYGIDRNEIGVPENEARGISHTGWTHYDTYTTSQGETRHKTEVLVAMSKNFASNATGTLFGTGAGTDASDDSVVADYLVYFTTQPVNSSNSAGNGVVLVAVAASEPTGATLTYQWYKLDNVSDTTYAVVNQVGVTGNTTDTLTIVNVSNVNGNIFRLTVSGDGGADDNTSTAVTVTAT